MPSEPGHSQSEAKAMPRSRATPGALRTDPAEDKIRLRARRIGFALMLASAIASVLVLYGAWALLVRH